MSVRAVIPFKIGNPKTRLSSFLNQKEREKFALCMLKDVVDALKASEVREIVVLTTSEDPEINGYLSASVACELSDKNLNEAINEAIHKTRNPILVIMSDLPLIREAQINEIINSPVDVVLAPGRRGGTNIMFLRSPSRFTADYYNISFQKHLKIAEERELSTHVYDSFFASTDIDEPEDLIELLIHGSGESTGYLKSLGVEVQMKENLPVAVRRIDDRK